MIANCKHRKYNWQPRNWCLRFFQTVHIRIFETSSHQLRLTSCWTIFFQLPIENPSRISYVCSPSILHHPCLSMIFHTSFFLIESNSSFTAAFQLALSDVCSASTYNIYITSRHAQKWNICRVPSNNWNKKKTVSGFFFNIEVIEEEKKGNKMG